MIRVAFIHNYFPAGGAERITVDIARYLKGLGGYEVFVYASRPDGSALTDEVRNVLNLRRIPSQAVPSKRASEVERLVVADRIDVLVQPVKALPGIEGIRQRTGCKVVLACHGEPFWQRHAITYRRQKGLVRRIAWHLYNKRRYSDGSLAMRMARERSYKEYLGCDAYTVLCRPYKIETASGFGIDPDMSHIHVIENPETPVADVCYDKENMILFCGRFENWSKRIDRLLRIWSKVQDRLPGWRLVLVGDGPAGKMLRGMASDLNLERISFEGMKMNVADYYRKASIVCLTSETEGWPLALSEAQAHGCIGMAFGSTSGISEILAPDEGCGFVVPPFDEDLYAETLVQVASLPEEDKLLIRKKSVQKRLNYAPEIIAEKWRNLFDSLV